MIIGSIYQEDIAILNIYAAKSRDSKYMKQKLLELWGEIGKWQLDFLKYPLSFNNL